ncbi:hypothetical protein GA0111570_11268 [Raineyella antarctica]|uniref:MinD-like ATPase involved in chromosome partitioning or flagellar assembly n=1 Tax=Raineyella antarctica TaxID=1577474 RepID=A0A1G6HSF5_9ACTN|nr:hypothetical protein [Raineyella antarctica]SDB97078.1 hypothetical protein GA0111570_11268 [Raineyella antarctica]
MPVHLIVGPAGSPGVTTTALGLALQHQGPVLLVDASRDAAQAVLAGYLRGTAAASSGLEEFARRRRMGAPFDLEAATVPLDRDGERRFLPGIGHLGAAELFESAWPDLADVLRRLADEGTHVVIDAGRGTSARTAEPLVRIADEVLLVARTSLRHLAAARPVVDVLDPLVARSPRGTRAGLALVGEGMPYDRHEVAAQFGWRVDLVLPFLPDHAAVLSDGAPPPRRWERSPLLEALRDFEASRLGEAVAR